MARDPNRIPQFMRMFEALWKQYPDMRFGQLFMDLSREPGGFADTWNWEEDDWLLRMMKYTQEHKPHE